MEFIFSCDFLFHFKSNLYIVILPKKSVLFTNIILRILNDLLQSLGNICKKVKIKFDKRLSLNHHYNHHNSSDIIIDQIITIITCVCLLKYDYQISITIAIIIYNGSHPQSSSLSIIIVTIMTSSFLSPSPS